MKIKQVEELVGITSKNIRFYEDQGLFHPNRSENGYRDYGAKDVELVTKAIKLGIGIHYGDMPEAVRKAVEKDFRNRMSGRTGIKIADRTEEYRKIMCTYKENDHGFFG